MRIALRTGAGRGAYELAGVQGEYSASDLFNRQMFYELTPGLILQGYATPDLRQGKPRINLDDSSSQGRGTHLYRLLAALLLLPQPRREFRKTSTNILFADKAFAITAITIDVVSVNPSSSVLRPKDILLENIGGFRERIDFIDRMARIIDVWRVAENLESEISRLLILHKSSVQSNPVNHKEIEKASQNILTHLNASHDPLIRIESILGINQFQRIEGSVEILETSRFGVDDETSTKAARVEAVRKWRKVAARGAAARQFSLNVKECYQDTCLFTGQRLPKLESTASSGVDAAHILPWASFGINSVSNGICLSKQSHWAFDSGVIKLTFDSSASQYIISIPENVLIDAQRNNFNLNFYQAMVGSIPQERLPSNRDLWPNHEYLREYNGIMFS